jgi:hypothetical protein
MRERLPEGLGDESSKVRTAVAMAVAAIARWDCPQQWPGLIPGLVQAITAKKNANLGELIRLESGRCCWPGRGSDVWCLRCRSALHAVSAAAHRLAPCSVPCSALLPAVNGSVRCLAMFVDEQGDEQVGSRCSPPLALSASVAPAWPGRALPMMPRLLVHPPSARPTCNPPASTPVAQPPANVHSNRTKQCRPGLQIMAIAPALLPELLAILRADEFGAGLQRRALAILHTILEVLQVRA